MGCAIFPDQKNLSNAFQIHRNSKRTQKIDCRRKSTHSFDVLLQNIHIQDQKLSSEDIQFICSRLKDHSLFSTLQAIELQKVATNMSIATAQKSQYIFKQGDPGTCFFLIKEGGVSIQVANKQVKKLSSGQCFGEVALIYCPKRTASIFCLENTTLYLLKRNQFKQVMKTIRQKYSQKTKKLIDNVQIFSLLTTKQKFTLLKSLTRQSYKKGEVLFTKNQAPYCFYIIQSGKVSLEFDDTSKKDIVLGQLQSFGESAFRKNGRREGTAKVVEDLNCLTINQQKMKQSLGGTLSNIVFHNIKKWALKSSPLFHNLQSKDIDQIAMEFVTKQAKAGVIIMDSQKPVNGLIICIEGKINSKPVGTLFNDQYYRANGGNLQKDLIKNQSGAYAVLSFEMLNKLFENIKNREKILGSQKRKSILNKQNEHQIGLDSFQYLKQLGEGQFGKVHLVKQKKSGNLFALKCLQKVKIKMDAIQQSVVSERDILSTLCHPLIVGFFKAYQDKKNIYFLLEYISGVDMFDAIRQIGLLNRIQAAFYVGSLALAVQYLHSKNIIYRDIKPENSIVNYQGRVFLIDMGTAKVLKPQNGYRTDTIIGTPHYMAPQVMQGRGYSFQSDYWSFGALLFQLICGSLPFDQDQIKQPELEPYKIYEYVMKKQIIFPKHLQDQKAKFLIKKLLTKDPKKRLVGGFTELKNSQYFQHFNWDHLYNGTMAPPYIPMSFRSKPGPKYGDMKGYPLVQFLYGKQRGDKKLTQQFSSWNNSFII